MPGEHHDIVIELLRSAPEALAVLLRERAGVHLPPSAHVTALDPSARQLRPVEFAADLVLRFAWRDRRTSVIVEVQRAVDEDKRRAWPLYFAHLRTRTRSPVELVIIATNQRTAAWAREPMRDVAGRMEFRPLVFGPDDVPVLDDEEAAAQPALALLSAFVHLEHDARVAIAARAVLAWHALDPRTSGLYLDALIAELGAVDGAALMEAVMPGQQPYRSEWGRGIYEKGIEDGAEQGLEAMRRALLAILEARSLSPDATTRRRIEACADTAQLEGWLERAATATTLDEVFEP